MNTSIFIGRSLIMVGNPSSAWSIRYYRYPNDTRPYGWGDSLTRRDSISEPDIALITNFATIDSKYRPDDRSNARKPR